jgi:hypothetical protein
MTLIEVLLLRRTNPPASSYHPFARTGFKLVHVLKRHRHDAFEELLRPSGSKQSWIRTSELEMFHHGGRVFRAIAYLVKPLSEVRRVRAEGSSFATTRYLEWPVRCIKFVNDGVSSHPQLESPLRACRSSGVLLHHLRPGRTEHPLQRASMIAVFGVLVAQLKRSYDSESLLHGCTFLRSRDVSQLTTTRAHGKQCLFSPESGTFQMWRDTGIPKSPFMLHSPCHLFLCLVLAAGYSLTATELFHPFK